MRRFHRTSLRSVTLVSVALVTACASSGPETAPADLGGGPQIVEMTVLNRADGTVTAFAQWRTGPRVRLGVIRAGVTSTFITPYRGSEVALTFEAAVPPPATGYPSAYAPTFIQIDMGDSVVFEIIRIFPPNVFSRRGQP